MITKKKRKIVVFEYFLPLSHRTTHRKPQSCRKKGQKSIVCWWKWTAAYKNNIGNDDISGLHHKKKCTTLMKCVEVHHYQKKITIIFRSYLILIVFICTQQNTWIDCCRLIKEASRPKANLFVVTLRNEIIKLFFFFIFNSTNRKCFFFYFFSVV